MVREKTVCRPVTTQCLRGHLRKNGQQSVYEYTYPVTHTHRDRHRCVCVFLQLSLTNESIVFFFRLVILTFAFVSLNNPSCLYVVPKGEILSNNIANITIIFKPEDAKLYTAMSQVSPQLEENYDHSGFTYTHIQQCMYVYLVVLTEISYSFWMKHAHLNWCTVKAQLFKKK